MRYEISKEDYKIIVKVTLSNFLQPDKSIKELEKMGIVKEVASASSIKDILVQEGYSVGTGSGPQISNFSNGAQLTGVYEFDNLRIHRPKPVKKMVTRNDETSKKTEKVAQSPPDRKKESKSKKGVSQSVTTLKAVKYKENKSKKGVSQSITTPKTVKRRTES